MNKTELIDKLLHLGNTTEMCCSTDRHNAKELAHTLLDEYLQAINVSGSFADGYDKGFKDGLEHRTLKCKCGKR
jgi:hypothetical protein